MMLFSKICLAIHSRPTKGYLVIKNDPLDNLIYLSQFAHHAREQGFWNNPQG